jgi:hypothetical protein
LADLLQRHLVVVLVVLVALLLPGRAMVRVRLLHDALEQMADLLLVAGTQAVDAHLALLQCDGRSLAVREQPRHRLEALLPALRRLALQRDGQPSVRDLRGRPVEAWLVVGLAHVITATRFARSPHPAQGRLAAATARTERSKMADDKPTLYVCHGDEKGPKMHPCRRVQEALKAKGVEYEKVIGGHGNPIPFLRRGSRDELEQATGQKALPALKLADGTVIAQSRKILDWIEHR